NPAYDATLSPTRIADIISDGVTIEAALRNVTKPINGKHPLFDNLLSNYSGKLAELQDRIGNFQTTYNSPLILQAGEDIRAKGISRCDGGSFQYSNTTAATVSASDELIKRLPMSYLIAHAAGLGAIRTCLNAVHANFHNGGPDGTLANVKVTVHFKYTPN